MHKRQTIRDRVVTVLTGLTTTGTNVYPSRIDRYSDAEMPALGVYCRNETLVQETNAKGYTGLISLELMIDCKVKENNTFDDTLDLILEEVQTALTAERASGTLPSITNGFWYAGIEEIEYEGGEKDGGEQTIIYTVEYEQQL